MFRMFKSKNFLRISKINAVFILWIWIFRDQIYLLLVVYLYVLKSKLYNICAHIGV